MTLKLPTAIQNGMASLVTNAVDAGPAAGTIKVYTGAQPATANDAPTGVLLLTWTLNDPAYGAPVAGVATLDNAPVISAVTVAAGTAGWFRIADSTGVTVYDGSVGAAPANQLSFDNAVLALGQTVNLLSGTLTQPSQ